MPNPTMLCADARELATLGIPAGSVDCIVTSPPYWDLKRYGDEHGDEIGHREDDYAKYVAAVGDVLKACLVLAKPEGVMWLVADTLRARGSDRGRQLPLPFDLAREAKRYGWRLQETVIWTKMKTLPYSGEGKLRNLFEYVLFFTRGRAFKHYPHRFAERHLPETEWLPGWPERYHPLGRRPSNVWEIPIPTQGMWSHSARLHFCPFPQQLVARCIGLTTDTGDTVLDPFAGVGTVAAQAVAMGRKGIGVELNPTNVELFRERTMPAFQANWEARASARALARDDQRAEAGLVLKLRLLKAGKEVYRLCDQLAQNSPSGHPAAAVEGVVVHDADVDSLIDIEAGTVGRPTARLTLVATLRTEERAKLTRALEVPMTAQPFSGLSLDFAIDICDPTAIGDAAGDRDLLQFGQSRHGAFTVALDDHLFPARPPLLTTVSLPAPVQPGALTPLELTRQQAERSLIESELARGGEPGDVARRLGLHRSQLEDLMVKHGLREAPRSFAVTLPEQLPVVVQQAEPSP